MVRSIEEETLNEMLDAKADRLCNAKRYKQTQAKTAGLGPLGNRQRQTVHTRPGSAVLLRRQGETTEAVQEFADRTIWL